MNKQYDTQNLSFSYFSLPVSFWLLACRRPVSLVACRNAMSLVGSCFSVRFCLAKSSFAFAAALAISCSCNFLLSVHSGHVLDAVFVPPWP